MVAAAGECGGEPVGRYLTIEAAGSDEALSAIQGLGIEARAALLAPLSFRGRPLGAIVALDRLEEGPDFYAEDERLLTAAAASAATAVATVQSVTEERLRQSLRATERERARWARELHDSVLQGLGSRRVLLSSALKRGDGPGLEAAVAQALEEMGRDIDELRGADHRAAARDPRPARPRRPRWKTSASDSSTAPGSSVAVELSIGAERLDPELETAVYRLVQEALTNVVKHADARERDAAGDGGRRAPRRARLRRRSGLRPGGGAQRLRPGRDARAGRAGRRRAAGRFEDPAPGRKVMASVPLGGEGGSGLDESPGERAAN